MPSSSVRAPRVPVSVASVLPLLVLAAACGDDSAAPPPPGPTSEVTIDASSTTAYRYFNLGTGQEVTVTSPTTDQNWDLAFRRFEIRLNGGVAGPKGVAGYNLENNASATPQQVIGFTRANQQAAFDAVTAADIPAAGSFTVASLAPDLTNWFRPNPAAAQPGQSQLVANQQRAWKFRRATAANGFAVVRIDSIFVTGTANQAALTYVRIRFRLQDGAGAPGAAANLGSTVPAGGSVYFNLTTQQVVATPSGCNWDVRVNANVEIAVNGAQGCTAGTFPLEANESFDALTNAGNAAQYAAFFAQITGPIPNSFDDPKGPFLYNLDPQNAPNRFYPTFNIYLVRVGSAVYKLQVVDYYNPANATQSGFPSIRYSKIQ